MEKNNNKTRLYQWVIGILASLIIVGLVGVIGDTRGEIKGAKSQITSLQKSKVEYDQYRIDLARMEKKIDQVINMLDGRLRGFMRE